MRLSLRRLASLAAPRRATLHEQVALAGAVHAQVLVQAIDSWLELLRLKHVVRWIIWMEDTSPVGLGGRVSTRAYLFSILRELGA